MMMRNYADLTRNEGRWLNLWAAFDVTAEYLGTFTLDELRDKAAVESCWISTIQYRRAGQRIDETALATRFNGLCRGDSPHDFTGFQISPVWSEARGPVDESLEVCVPGDHAFWSIYGFHGESREWLIVHDCQTGEEGEILARLVELTGNLVEYRDAEKAYANTRLADLPALLSDRIHDEIPGHDHHDARTDDADCHPLTPLRESILEAIARRA